MDATSEMADGVQTTEATGVNRTIDVKRRPFASWPIVVALLGAHYGLGLTSVLRQSCSVDEIAHLTAGYTHWRTGDFRLVPEHPPLAKLWAALPLNFMSVKLPSLDLPSWRNSDQWRFGWEFFYQQGNDAQRMLLAGRAMIGLFSVALGLAIYGVSRRWFGPVGGLISLAVFAFSPEMLAHGFQITTDLPATLFFLLSFICISRGARQISPGSTALCGLALAALFTTKMSAALVIPIYGLMILINCASSRPLEVKWRQVSLIHSGFRKLAVHGIVLVIHVSIVAGGIWLTHGLRFQAFAASTPGVDRFSSTNTEFDMGQPEWDYELSHAGWIAPAIEFARDHHLLPEAYLYGVAFAKNMTRTSEAFLNGERSGTGFRMYFPYAFLFKTTLPLLVLLLSAAIVWTALFVFRRPRPTADFFQGLPFIAFFILYWIVAVVGSFNIGHRHLLPVYPMLMIFVGILGTLSFRRNLCPAAVTVMLLLHGTVALRSWPYYLSFFNDIAGGSKNGYRHFVDSSVDWGQDLLRLSDWLRGHNPPDSPRSLPVYLSYFGSGSADYYGIHARILPTNGWWQRGEYPVLEPGLYCISATLLQQVYLLPLSRWSPELERVYQLNLPRIKSLQDSRMAAMNESSEDRLRSAVIPRFRFGRLCAFLRQRAPDADIGHSIFIYRVTNDELGRALFGPPPPMTTESADDYAKLADDLSADGLTGLPEEWYRRALSLRPNEDRWHFNLGNLLLRQRRYDDAAGEYQEALRLNDQFGEAYHNLAVTQMKAGKMGAKNAIELMKKAISLRPLWSEAHVNLAMLYGHEREWDQAIAEYETALRLHPNLEKAKVGLKLAREQQAMTRSPPR